MAHKSVVALNDVDFAALDPAQQGWMVMHHGELHHSDLSIASMYIKS